MHYFSVGSPLQNRPKAKPVLERVACIQEKWGFEVGGGNSEASSNNDMGHDRIVQRSSSAFLICDRVSIFEGLHE